MSPAEQQENLRLVNQSIGWGDPERALWFVGLEEAAQFDMRYLGDLRDRRARFSSPLLPDGSVFWQTPDMVREASQAPSRLDWGEGALCAALSAENDTVSEYVRAKLWKRCTFHCNLYALGFQRSGGGFPRRTYSELFGICDPSDERLYGMVLSRHESIRRLMARCAPQATVCLSLQKQSEFESAFDLGTGEERGMGSSRAIVYEPQKTVVVPHASWPIFRRALPGLVLLLREWGVSV